MCGRCVYLCDKDSPRLRLRSPFVELILNKGRYITCSYIIPFLMGSQLARFAQHTSWYERLEAALFASNAAAFSLLLVLGFAFFVMIQKLGAQIFGITEDPSFGKFSPLIPVLVPFAFTGELVYRLDYFLSNIGYMIPTFGRQFGINLEGFFFAVPKPFIFWIGILTLTIGAVSGGYVLHIFNSRDFEGTIERKRYYTLHLIVVLIFAGYSVLFEAFSRL